MDHTEVEDDKILNEEYKVWKKNSPYLYDLVFTHALEWPSLTVQWLSDVSKCDERKVSIHKMILGTHTSEGEQNYLMLAEALLPLPNTEIDARKYDDERGEVGGFGGTLSKIDVKIKINHEGEVHRARAMPQNQFLVATKSPSSTVFVFDYSKHGSVPVDNVCRPQHRCFGHSAEGYGLSWNLNEAGILLSGSDDNNICLWDIKEAGMDVNALQTKSEHNSVVEDVDWNKLVSHHFVSVGDDRKIILWDKRQDSSIQTKENAHKGDINCVSFNPFNEYLLATGSSDGIVALWDIRNMTQQVHTLEGHKDGVYQLDWAPFGESILASSSSDRRVNIWDISRIGEEQDPEDAEDGPPELLFIHGGHTAKISDFHWNKNDEWVAASVAEDNILQIWQLTESIYAEGDEEDEVDLKEEEDLELEEADDSGLKRTVDETTGSDDTKENIGTTTTQIQVHGADNNDEVELDGARKRRKQN